MPRKSKVKRVRRRKNKTKKNTGKGSGVSKPYKPNYTQEQLLLNEAQNIYANITIELHQKLNFNNNKGPNQKYGKMYGLIVNRANLKKIEKKAWRDALDQVFGTTTDGIVLNPNEARSKKKTCKKRRRKRKNKKRN